MDEHEIREEEPLLLAPPEAAQKTFSLNAGLQPYQSADSDQYSDQDPTAGVTLAKKAVSYIPRG